MVSRRERVKDLVRKLDAVNAERESLARDAVRIEREIDELIGESAADEVPTAPMPAAQLTTVSRFSKAGLVLQMVKAAALPETSALAVKLYGENTGKTRNRARALLYFLEKKRGMIRKTRTGNYEIAEAES